MLTLGWDAVALQAADPVFGADTETIRTCLCVLLDAEGGRPGLKPVRVGGTNGIRCTCHVYRQCTHDMINNENFTM